MQYVITDLNIENKNRCVEFLLDDNRDALEIYFSEDDDELSVSDIFTAKVEKVLKSSNSAFLNIGNSKTVFLQYKKDERFFYSHKFSKDDSLHVNDEIVIEIKNTGIKTKKALATSKFSLREKSLLLVFGDSNIHVSKKIGDERKGLLIKLFQKKLEEMDSLSILDECMIMIRSNAKDESDEELLLELENLIDSYKEFKKKAIHLNPFTKILKAPKHYIEKLIHSSSKIEKVVTDKKSVYEELALNKRFFPEVEIEFYESDFELYKLFSLNQKIERALKKYVDLKSGANITIESTEAMNVIDVNSANSSKLKSQSKEDYFFKVNKEAAIEAAKQIRLRNLSGIIIIDFINMKDESNLDKIMKVLEKEFMSDPLKVNVIDRTALGLVEITREKKYASLKQQLTS